MGRTELIPNNTGRHSKCKEGREAGVWSPAEGTLNPQTGAAFPGSASPSVWQCRQQGPHDQATTINIHKCNVIGDWLRTSLLEAATKTVCLLPSRQHIPGNQVQHRLSISPPSWREREGHQIRHGTAVSVHMDRSPTVEEYSHGSPPVLIVQVGSQKTQKPSLYLGASM